NDAEYIREVLVWDIASGKIRHRLEGLDDSPRGVACSADGKMLATGDATGHVIVWDLQSGAPWAWGRMHEHQREVHSLAFSPDSPPLVTGSSDTSFKVSDLPRDPAKADKPLISRATRRGYKYPIEIVRFAADGKTFLVTCNGMTEVWDCAAVQKR